MTPLMKTSRIADEDSVSKEIKYIHTIHRIIYLCTVLDHLKQYMENVKVSGH
jgi:hypothetical protein